MMSIAFCFSSIGAAASIISYFEFSLTTGGPFVLIWGWLFSSFFLLITGKKIKNLELSKNLSIFVIIKFNKNIFKNKFSIFYY